MPGGEVPDILLVVDDQHDWRGGATGRGERIVNEVGAAANL